MNKSKLRKEILFKRKLLLKDYKNENEEKIALKVISLIKKNDFKSVLIYLSKEDEVSTVKIIDYLFENNITVAVPICDYKNKTMNFYIIDKNSRYCFDEKNIKIPLDAKSTDAKNFDFAVVPCVGAQKNGYRLGYGGGYYDRFLKDFRGVSATICFKDFIIDFDFIEPFDIKTDYVIF